MDHFFLDGYELTSYNYLILCHNTMLSLVKRANRRDWHNIKLKLKQGDEELLNNHDIEYLRLHGYKEEISSLYYRHMFFSVWADYLDYTYEANIAASKMKASIAYSLLRKPLKDNLYFLEVLENKGVEFIYEFLDKSIDEFSIDKIDEETKRNTIYEVSKDVFSKSYAETLYNIRYSKKEDIRFRKNME